MVQTIPYLLESECMSIAEAVEGRMVLVLALVLVNLGFLVYIT